MAVSNAKAKLSDEGVRAIMEIYHDAESKKGWEVLGVLQEVRIEAIQGAIAIMINDLYDLEREKVEGDIAKITLMDSGQDIRPEPQERMKLLRVLWWIFEVYFNGDVSALLEKCKNERNP